MEEAYSTATEKGFHDKEKPIPECLMLIVSELAEVLEDHRKGSDVSTIHIGPDGKPYGIPVEFADAVIRLCDTCQKYDIPLERAIVEKMAYNKTRMRLHGKLY